MSSWLIPVLLFAARVPPTRQESTRIEPRLVSLATTPCSPGCAFVVGPRLLGGDIGDQLESRRGRDAISSVGRPPRWRGRGRGSNSSSSRPRARRRRAQATMDFDGPPELGGGGGDGKNGVAARDEVLQQDVALGVKPTTVELPDVQAPVDLPQVCVCARMDSSDYRRQCKMRVFSSYFCHLRGSNHPVQAIVRVYILKDLILSRSTKQLRITWDLIGRYRGRPSLRQRCGCSCVSSRRRNAHAAM